MLNPTREVWKIIFLFKGVIFQFHVSFWGSTIFKNFRKLSYVYTTVVSEIVTSYHNWRFNFFRFLHGNSKRLRLKKNLHMKKNHLTDPWEVSKHTPLQLFRDDSLLLPKNLPISHVTFPKQLKNKKNILQHTYQCKNPQFSFSCSFYPFIPTTPMPPKLTKINPSPTALGISMASLASPFSSFSAFSASNSVGPVTLSFIAPIYRPWTSSTTKKMIFAIYRPPIVQRCSLFIKRCLPLHLSFEGCFFSWFSFSKVEELRRLSGNEAIFGFSFGDLEILGSGRSSGWVFGLDFFFKQKDGPRGITAWNFQTFGIFKVKKKTEIKGDSRDPME